MNETPKSPENPRSKINVNIYVLPETNEALNTLAETTFRTKGQVIDWLALKVYPEWKSNNSDDPKPSSSPSPEDASPALDDSAPSGCGESGAPRQTP